MSKSEEVKKVENKFFDKPIPKVVKANIDYEIEQLRLCLESENVKLSTSDIIKSLDIYCRVWGLDNPANMKDGTLKAISTWLGVISFNGNNLSEDAINAIKSAIITINNKSSEENKISDINIIIDNINIIAKEYAIFMNELFNSVYDVCSSTKDCIKTTFYIVDGSRDRFMSIGCSMILELKEFVFDLSSNVISNINPKNVSILLKTFNEEDQNILKSNKESYSDPRVVE